MNISVIYSLFVICYPKNDRIIIYVLGEYIIYTKIFIKVILDLNTSAFFSELTAF